MSPAEVSHPSPGAWVVRSKFHANCRVRFHSVRAGRMPMDGPHDHHCKNEIQPKRDKPTEDARKRTSERGWRGKHEQQIKQRDDESKSQRHWMGSTCKVIPAICPPLRDAKRYRFAD